MGSITAQNVKTMPIDFDIETSYLFKKGEKIGEKKGEKRVIDNTIKNLLKQNKLSIPEIAEVANVKESYVLKLKEQLEKS